jgi:hypothetical protein
MENNNALTNVFSGADVVVIFGNSYIGEAMSITIGVNREAGPLYVMGRKEPIAIPKGKRGIGGSFILAQLGYDALLKYYESIMGRKQPIWVRSDESVPNIGTRRTDITSYGADNVALADDGTLTSVATTDLWEQLYTPNYVDQMPPFNMTIVGVNETGEKMGFRIYGVTIINEGMAISVDELNMEKRYTFIAQSVSRMQKLDSPD